MSAEKIWNVHRRDVVTRDNNQEVLSRGIATWACATLVLFGCFVSGLGGDCVIDERSGDISTDGVSRIRVDVQAGSLEVNGDSQSGQIHYKAEFKGNTHNDKSAQQILEQMEISHRRSGDTLTILTHTSNRWWGGSREIEVYNVGGSADIQDSSGGIRVVDVAQNVVVSDPSGRIWVLSVGRDFEVTRAISGGIRSDGVKSQVRIL